MSESIDRIISEGAFEQLKKLLSELEQADTKMQGFIKTVDTLRKSLEGATGLKEVSEEYKKLVEETGKLNKATEDKIEIEKEVNKESSKIASGISGEREELKKNLTEQNNRKKKMEEIAITMVDHQKKLQDVSKELKESKAQYSTSGAGSDELKRKIGDLMVEEAALKNTIAEGSTEFKRRVTESQNEDTSLKAKTALLSRLKSEYDRLSEGERNNSAVGGELKLQMNELDKELKNAKCSIGGSVKVIGNCELSVGRLKLKFREMMESVQAETFLFSELGEQIGKQTQKVNQTAQAHGVSSQEYKDEVTQLEALKKAHKEAGIQIEEMQKKAGSMKDIIADTNDAITAWSSDTANVDAVVTGLDTMVQGYTVVQASMTALGVESKELMNIFAKLQILQQGVNAVQKIADNLTKESVFKSKLKNYVSKIRLAYTEAQLKATTQETVSEAANTASTAANTAAQKANTASKSGNTVSTAGAATATGGLSAANTVATATSFSLSAAIHAVGTAIKNIPLVGWLMAGTALLVSLGKLVYKLATSEKELTEEQKMRNEVMKKNNELRYEAMEGVEKEKATLNLNISLMKKLQEGTDSWKKAVENTAEQLGVSSEWIIDNRDQVDALAKAWYDCKIQQALADKYAEESANSYLESEKQIMNVGGNLEEREEAIDAIEQLSEEDRKRWKRAEHLVRSGNATERKEAAKTIELMKKKTREYATEVSKTFRGKAEEAATMAASYGEALQEARTSGGAYSSDSSPATSSAEAQRTKNAEIAKERVKFVEDVNKKIADLEARSDAKIYALKQQRLQEDLDKSLSKYGKDKEARIAIIRQYELERMALEEEYQKKQVERIEAATQEATTILMSLNEARLKSSNITEEQLAQSLIENERVRNQNVLKENEKAFAKEVETLEEGSAEYLAIRRKWDAKNEQQVYDSTQREIAIRKQGFNAMLLAIQQQTKDSDNQLTIEAFDTDMPKEDVEAQRQQLKIDGIMQEIEAYRLKKENLEELGMTEEEYTSKMLELQASLATEQTAQHERTMAQLAAQKEARQELALTIGDSLFSIGNAIAEGVEDEKQKVIIQQSLAMAQVMLEQAVAISKAVSSATEGDPYTIAIRIAAAVGAVVTSFISARNAINQAQQSVNQANAYAEGTSYHKGGAAVVGEAGKPELVYAAGKQFVVERPTYFKKLPTGSKVIPLDNNYLAEQPTALIENLPISSKIIPLENNIYNQSHSIDLTEIINQLNAIQNRSLVKIDVGENVYTHIVKGSTQTRILNSQFSH